MMELVQVTQKADMETIKMLVHFLARLQPSGLAGSASGGPGCHVTKSGSFPSGDAGADGDEAFSDEARPVFCASTSAAPFGRFVFEGGMSSLVRSVWAYVRSERLSGVPDSRLTGLEWPVLACAGLAGSILSC